MRARQTRLLFPLVAAGAMVTGCGSSSDDGQSDATTTTDASIDTTSIEGGHDGAIDAKSDAGDSTTTHDGDVGTRDSTPPPDDGSTACTPGSGGSVFGMTIPTDHPRILFDGAHLAKAKAWWSAHTPTVKSDDYLGLAMQGLLADDAASCASAITWAKAQSAGMRTDGTACDDCRWDGENIILVYDWCFSHLDAASKSALEASTDAWIDHWRTQSWGGVPMHENNYYWGYLRNELEWATTRQTDDPTLATTLYHDAFDVRLASDFFPATGVVGGLGQEGAQYGRYILYYMSVPLVMTADLGRNLICESDYFLSGIYAYVYETTPAAASDGQFEVFTWNDNDAYAPSSAVDSDVADFMTVAAQSWPTSPAGGHARQWMKTVGADADLHLQAIDDGAPAATPFDALPLDYFAAGPRYLFSRSSWDSNATALMFELGSEDGVGHDHLDFGSFQIVRGGHWLSRESVGYGGSGIDLVGLGGSGTSDVREPVAHNVVASGGALPDDESASPVVTRLESQPGYVFASVDLTSAFSGSKHVVRDMIFVRDLETLVVYDRGADTFLAHCETAPVISGPKSTCTVGTDALVTTALLGSPTLHDVVEGSPSGQHRVEIVTSGGTMLTVLQAKDASAAALSPSVSDTGSQHVLTLDATHSITFTKGASSTGGSIMLGGATTPVRADVQSMIVDAAGPVWK